MPGKKWEKLWFGIKFLSGFSIILKGEHISIYVSAMQPSDWLEKCHVHFFSFNEAGKIKSRWSGHLFRFDLAGR
jgi:hypothetical protein